jgi:hypothetical protein
VITAKNWNNGMLEYWNIGKNERKKPNFRTTNCETEKHFYGLRMPTGDRKYTELKR